ncbi:MAG: calcium/sodium antiporter [Burkholderiales bacterium]|nr:calcium/sodium antiporter [Burkholderiales bacterium]
MTGPLEIGAGAFAGLAALYFGARWLVGAASDVARRLGVSPLLVGLTVVAVGTSLPELFVAVSAAIGGHAGVSLGNVVGANALNIGLILGVAALVQPIRVELRVLKWDLPVMFGASALLGLVAADGHVGRAEGLLLLCAMAAYLAANVALGRRERAAAALSGAIDGAGAASVFADLARAGAGIGALSLGAHLLVEAAVAAAAAFSIAEGAIGMTLVAAATTLPELVTTLVAAWRRQGDLAFGNILGSNIANALAVVGVAAAAAPLAADLGVRAIVALLALTLLAAPVMWRGFVVTRAEGALLVCGYAAFLWFGLGL